MRDARLDRSRSTCMLYKSSIIACINGTTSYSRYGPRGRGRGLGTRFSFRLSILPHPRSPGGKPQRLTARIKIARAPVFPTASFSRRGQFPICPSVRVVTERRPKFGSKAARVAPSNAATQILVFPVERRFRHEPSFRGPGREQCANCVNCENNLSWGVVPANALSCMRLHRSTHLIYSNNMASLECMTDNKPLALAP